MQSNYFQIFYVIGIMNIMAKSSSCCKGIQPASSGSSFGDLEDKEKTTTMKTITKEECVPCYEESVVPVKCPCETNACNANENSETDDGARCISPQESMCKREKNACERTISTNNKQNPSGGCATGCGC